MKTIIRIIGYLMFMGAGIFMFIFWFLAMSKWLGLLGVVLAFVLVPGAVIFPLIFWIVEGIFPSFYFILWGVGIIGTIMVGACGDDK